MIRDENLSSRSSSVATGLDGQTLLNVLVATDSASLVNSTLLTRRRCLVCLSFLSSSVLLVFGFELASALLPQFLLRKLIWFVESSDVETAFILSLDSSTNSVWSLICERVFLLSLIKLVEFRLTVVAIVALSALAREEHSSVANSTRPLPELFEHKERNLAAGNRFISCSLVSHHLQLTQVLPVKILSPSRSHFRPFTAICAS